MLRIFWGKDSETFIQVHKVIFFTIEICAKLLRETFLYESLKNRQLGK